VPFPVAVLLPVPEVDLEAVLEVGLGTEAVLVAGLGIEVGPGTVAVLEAVHEVGLGTEAVLGVDPGIEAAPEAGPGTVADPEVDPGIEVDLEVDPGTEAVLGVGPGTEVGPGIEAGPALAEGEHSLVVAEEELQAQTEGELADPALSHAWALHSCPCPALEAPCEAGDSPGDSRQDDHTPLGAWRGCWGRDSPEASDPGPSSSAPPPASDARSSGTPPQ